MVIMETDRSFDEKEKLTDEYYKFEYWCEKLQLEEIEIEFEFPEKNKTIPSKFKIKNRVRNSDWKKESPSVLVKDSLWFKPSLYREPLGIINVLLAKPEFFNSTIENYSLTTLLINSFRMKYKNDFHYYCNSGHEVKMNLLDGGIEFKFSGYNHKLGEFVKSFIQQFKNYITSGDCLEIFEHGMEKFKLSEISSGIDKFFTVTEKN